MREINERQRRFAEYIASGMTAVKAYVQAGYCGNNHTAKANASHLLKRPCVQSYLKELRKPRAEAATMTLQQKREYLRRLVRPEADPAQTDGDIARISEKLKAIELDSKLAGHFTAAKGELGEGGKFFEGLPEVYGLPSREEIEEAERE